VVVWQTALLSAADLVLLLRIRHALQEYEATVPPHSLPDKYEQIPIDFIHNY
jgi:hypothetical protein